MRESCVCIEQYNQNLISNREFGQACENEITK